MTRKHMFPAVAAVVLAPALVQAQFSSGSTGSDGPLNFTTPGTVVFDPLTLGLNAAGDNVFNFTTINIGAGVTVVLKSSLMRQRSVVWLATGNVTITGTLNLNGADGALMGIANPGLTRSPSDPGPGGFPGGVGGYLNQPPQPGGGFGGGAVGTVSSLPGDGVYSYFNNQLVPLYGGAGGGGAVQGTGTAGGNGGAGGGAIRIVSSTSITVTGNFFAAGGAPGQALGGNALVGGRGAGGVIHLVAPTISGSGFVFVGNATSAGVIKLSTNNNTSNFSTGNSPLIVGGLYNPPLPSGVPAVQVVSVNGVAAPAEITASYLVPDFTINASATVAVNIAAQNIPTGTVVKLFLTSEQLADTTVSCAPLTGSLASSTATCTGVGFPSGVTITNIRANW